MKKILLLIFCSMVVGYIACKAVNGNPDDAGSNEQNNDEIPVPDGYKLLWEDRFDASVLNQANWNIEINGNGGGNNELQYYRAENISVDIEPESGKRCLVITAKKENYGGKQITSGRVNTKNKRSFKFGRIDALIKMPRTANGLWPAFWLMGTDFDAIGWPKCGEIDVVEMGHKDGYNNRQNKYFNGACHWGTQYPQASHSMFYSAPYDVQDDFHLFTLVWDDQSIKTYLDIDKYQDVAPYFTMDISDKSGELSPGNYFQKDFFILMNLAIGGDYPQIWDINNVTALASSEAKMYIDYVRVYEKYHSQ